MRTLISAMVLLFLTCWSGATTLQIEVSGSGVNLSWETEELGIDHYLVQASSDPYDFSACQERRVTNTTSYRWDRPGNMMFFRVIPVKNFVSITAKRTTYTPDRGRLFIDSCYVTVESEGLERAYRMIKGNREFVVKDGIKLSWKNQEFQSKKSVTTFTGDPSLNLDNGYFQFLGKHFDYPAWANANGWLLEVQDDKYLLSNGNDTLLVDVNTTLLVNKVSHVEGKTFKTEFIWKYLGSTPVLWHVNHLEYRNGTLFQMFREEYSDWVINPSKTINEAPEDYPDLSLPAMPQLTEVQPLQSNCPIRGYVEDMSQAIPSNLRSGTPAQISCTQCHTQVGQGFILFHGLASNPSVMDPLELYLQQNFPSSIVIRPYMPHEYTITQMIDSLSARLPLFGAIQWMGIAHSQGGLVARGLAQNNLLSQLLVLASPQQGSPVAMQENSDYAMWIFNDLQGSLNACDNWFGWATNIFSDGSSSLAVLRSQLQYILSCGSIPDLRPGSEFLTELNADSTLVPHRTLKAKFDRNNPVKGMWAGLTTQYQFPYPYSQLDDIRTQNFNTIQGNWNDWIDDCESYNWIGCINALRHDLEGMENRWKNNVIEAGVLEVRTEPFYTYHAPGTCFYCTYTPACVTNGPEPPDSGREFYCDSFEEQDGSVLWCCDEGSCSGLFRCYHGEHVVEVVYAENDGIVRNAEESYGDGWPIDNVDHFSATRSTAFNQDIYETIVLWRP
jgi:hypothetical protein